MGLENFIPEIWSAKLFSDYKKSLVLGSLTNSDYEGEIRSFGDTVKINAVGPISVNDWTKNSTSMTVQPLAGAGQTLVIDKADQFAFFVDDIDIAQQNPKVMGTAMQNAAYALADKVDQRIAALYTDAGVTLTTAAVGPTLIAEKLATINRKFDDNNVPTQGRWLVVPPWMIQSLALGAIGYAPSTNQGVKNINADGVWQSGRVGAAMGFEIYMSNNLAPTANDGSTGREQYILAGTRDAITFADSISKVEAYRPELQFADAVKGLHVYGYRVIQPKALIACPFAESTV